MRAWADTHVGQKRDHNEDSYLARPDVMVFAVADGMGGLAAGEVASTIAVTKLNEIVDGHRAAIHTIYEAGPPQILNLMPQALHETLASLNNAVLLEACHRGVGKMGSTLSLIWFVGPFAFVAHTGDSRIYRLRDGVLQRLTQDQSINNMLIGGLGLYRTIKGDVQVHSRVDGDRYLLCSDGVTAHMNGNDLVHFMLMPDPATIVPAIIQEVNRRGGIDNITAIVVEDVWLRPASGPFGGIINEGPLIVRYGGPF